VSSDYRAMFDRDFIGSWDLEGREAVVVISKVRAETLTAQGSKKSKRPVVWFEGKEKAMVLNKTNAKTIAGMYGADTTKWVGKRIAIYPTTTKFGPDTVDCIRVRPTIPQQQAKPATAREPGVD